MGKYNRKKNKQTNNNTFYEDILDQLNPHSIIHHYHSFIIVCIVDGGWSSWGAWGSCSKSCATGLQTRIHNCTNPPPSNGGAACVGSSSQSQTCNTETCPSGTEMIKLVFFFFFLSCLRYFHCFQSVTRGSQNWRRKIPPL